MAAKTENLVLEHLRSIRADVAAVREDQREIKARLAGIESGIASLKRDSADHYGDIASQHVRYDKITERLERVEKRLDLVAEG